MGQKKDSLVSEEEFPQQGTQKYSVTTTRPISIQSSCSGCLLNYKHRHFISEHNVTWQGVSLVIFGQLSQLCLLPGSCSLQVLLPGHWARTFQHWCILVINLNSTIQVDVKKTNCIPVKPSTFCFDILEFASPPTPFHLLTS